MRPVQRLLWISGAAVGAVRPEIWAAGGLSARTMGSRAKEELVAQISDAKLLRTQCYVGGQWIEASDGGKLEVRTASAGACCRLPPPPLPGPSVWHASIPHCCPSPAHPSPGRC